MHDWQSLTHVRWDCKYHVVIVPKYRKKRLYGKFRKSVGQIIGELCQQKRVELVEGHLMPDHIHTIGLDEKVIRKYIRDQEKLEKLQLDLELY